MILTTRLSTRGQVVIPLEIRKLLKLKKGQVFTLQVRQAPQGRQGLISLKPVKKI